jgi:hypothetical protein
MKYKSTCKEPKKKKDRVLRHKPSQIVVINSFTKTVDSKQNLLLMSEHVFLRMSALWIVLLYALGVWAEMWFVALPDFLPQIDKVVTQDPIT